jgi:tRNA(Ile)-lysidine synthase
MAQPFSAFYLPAESSAIIGVSGGQDSLCLLHLARAIPSLKITVAHFNHRLRINADDEAGIVHNVADQMGLPFVTDSADVRGFARDNHLSLEEAARLLRYRFLFYQARACHASVVAVGHTADDQVETILMHFLRGAGLAGLKGMNGRSCPNEFDQEIPLVRPIMHLWRRETASYCLEHDLHPIVDPTNSDESYFRNWLRNSLIPEIEQHNPSFKKTLLRTAEALAGDHLVVTDAVEAAWQKVVTESGSGYIGFRASSLAGIPHGLLRNVVRRGMEILQPNIRNVDFDTLQRAADFITTHDELIPAARLGRVDLTAGHYIQREGDTLYLVTNKAELPSAHWPLIESTFELKIDQRVAINESTSISAQRADVETARRSAQSNDDPFTAWMDADLTENQFSVRTRRPGDHFQPLGLNGHSIKLSDFFINAKLPGRARDKWPLVIAGGEIAWVPGFRLAHPFRITQTTIRAVKMVLEKK